MFELKISFEVPEYYANPLAAERTHNKWIKDILREEIQNHLDKRIDRHFVFSARSRYGYAPRSQKYQRTKIKYRGRTTNWNPPVTFAADANLDLIKTGRTKREIKQGAKITVSGTGTLTRARLRLQVPIPGGTGRDLSLAASLRILSSKSGRRKFLARHEARQRMDVVRRTIKEIEAFARDEIEEISRSCAKKYVERMMTRKRVRKL